MSCPATSSVRPLAPSIRPPRLTMLSLVLMAMPSPVTSGAMLMP